MSVSENLKIEIRPIPNRDGIKGFSENLEYFSQAHVISAFVDPVSRKYKTGLTDEDIAYLKGKGFPYDISDTYVAGRPHPFWESAMVKTELKNSPTFLFPGESELDFVKYKYLLVNNYIYKSESEMLTGTKPEATHYIYNESEEISIKANKLEKKNSLIAKIGKLSTKRKKDLVLIILNENVSNKDDDYLTVKFDDILADAENTKVLTELLERNVEDVSLSAEIKTAIQSNVLRRTREGIFFFETNLGFSENDVKENLLKPEFNELYLNIKSKI